MNWNNKKKDKLDREIRNRKAKLKSSKLLSDLNMEKEIEIEEINKLWR